MGVPLTLPAEPLEAARGAAAETLCGELSPLRDRQRALVELLAGDLDFRRQDSAYASHTFHAFAAKFPPQLPRVFIEGLTEPGEVVLDPMMGSGTSLIEAYLLDRRGIGFDLDPLAIRQTQVKTTWLAPDALTDTAAAIIGGARDRLARPQDPAALLRHRYLPAAVAFIEYWFAPATQRELLALVEELEQLPEGPTRRFMEVAFSSAIITKSGGVSLARDLAHTRPHRVTDKRPRDAVTQFEARTRKNIASLANLPRRNYPPEPRHGDARQLPLPEASVDLVITSPPYANAIDYMRAHKFSLVWFGSPMDELRELRARAIGSERAAAPPAGGLPERVEALVQQVQALDVSRARVLRKYYHEMRAAISELFRVLRPGRCAVIVVGSSTMRGVDVETHRCLTEIAAGVGFEVAGVAARRLDRDKRLMPARWGSRGGTAIEERMHEEYVIGCVKGLGSATGIAANHSSG